MSTTAIPRSAPASPWEPPGGLLVWLIVLLEVLTFGVGLTAFAAQGREHAVMFRDGRAALNQTIALANTLVLLTGGWFMANAVTRIRQDRAAAAAKWMNGAALAAAIFLTLKGLEYADKLAHGHSLRSDSFHTFYWLLTGFHFLHVAAALVLMLCMGWKLRRGCYSAAEHGDVEGSGIFWHLCDFIWLLLYPVIYLWS